ncbi:alpha-E domain-containing protein [Nocardia sp. NPDC004654]|uniref:alpha-E domain-containing protein n=1 Tax=Nocardia sp. NPDC004654 TaxID=3154776 RepID=UPI0033ACC01B
MAALAATTCTAAPDAVIGDGGPKLESRGGEPGSGGGAPEAASAGGEPESGGGEPQALGGGRGLGGRESESGREDQGSDGRKLGPGSGESGSGGGEPEALGGGRGLGGRGAESGREDQGSDDRKLRPGSGEPGSGGGEIEALGGGPGLGGAEAESGRGDLGSGGGKPGLGGGKPGLGGGKLGRGGAKPEPRGGESRAFGGGLGPGDPQVESGGGKQPEAGGAEPASSGEMGSGGAESELGGAADGFTAASASEGNGGVAAVAGASREGHDYLEALTIDRELPGSLAYAIDRYGSSARAVRDQLSHDTWMILGSVDRALAEYRESDGDETALSAVHSLTLAALLSLSGIEAESLVRDIGWCVMDIGKRIERGLAVTALLSSALTETYPAEAELVVTEAVLQAAESSVSYRRRHRDSVRVSAVAGLLLFDRGNPRSLAYQLERLDANFAALPGASGSSRPQRLLADAQRMLRRVDPDDLNVTDENGRRTELAELLDGVHLRLRKVAESFETTKLSLPVGIQPLWGSTRVVG